MDAVDELIEQLKHWDWDMREIAAYKLGFLKDKKSIQALIEASGDQYVGVRIGSGLALTYIINSSSLQELPDIEIQLKDAGIKERQSSNTNKEILGTVLRKLIVLNKRRNELLVEEVVSIKIEGKKFPQSAAPGPQPIYRIKRVA